MKVKDLIEELSKYSGDCEVYLRGTVMEDAYLEVEKEPGSNLVITVMES